MPSAYQYVNASLLFVHADGEWPLAAASAAVSAFKAIKQVVKYKVKPREFVAESTAKWTLIGILSGGMNFGEVLLPLSSTHTQCPEI